MTKPGADWPRAQVVDKFTYGVDRTRDLLPFLLNYI